MDNTLNIFIIKLMKFLNVWSHENYDKKDIFNYRFLIENGYICDLDLSMNNTYIVVYYNKNNKKLIVYLDGGGMEYSNYFESLDFLKCKNLFDEYSDRVKKTVNIINQKYNDYQKLYLGYCLGGYMLNNYVNGENIRAYTYNCFGIKHTNNNIQVTNYCQELDLQNCFWRLDKNSKVINSHENFAMEQLLNFRNFDLANIILHIHVVNTVDDNLISIEF